MERIKLKSLEGIIKIREWPNWLDPNDETEFLKWRKRITEKEWDRYTVAEGRNLITNLGVNGLFQNIGNSTQSFLQPFSQIMSVGNGAITGVLRTDTAVAGDGFGTNSRRQPNSLTVTGFQADVGTNYLAADAQATWTNLGFYGYKFSASQNATTTAGTGELNTHALISYLKAAIAITVDYVYTLQN